MNKKTKKNFSILLICFLILIFIFNNNLFRKIYNISNFSFEDRIIKSSGFCSKDSIGYLNFLKKKFNFNFNPEVINYEDSVPSSSWPIYDNHLKDNPDYKILLNYPGDFILEFYPDKNDFYSKNTIEYGKGISKIYFDLKIPTMKFDSNLIIYTKIFGTNEKNIIYNEPFKEVVKNQQKITLPNNLIKINNIYKPMFLDIKHPEKNKINNIKVIVKNEYDLSKHKILDSYKNCYYIK